MKQEADLKTGKYLIHSKTVRKWSEPPEDYLSMIEEGCYCLHVLIPGILRLWCLKEIVLSFRYSQLLRNKLQTSVKEFWPAEARGELDRKEKEHQSTRNWSKNSLVTAQSHPRWVGPLVLWCESKPTKTGLTQGTASQPIFSILIYICSQSPWKQSRRHLLQAPCWLVSSLSRLFQICKKWTDI